MSEATVVALAVVTLSAAAWFIATAGQIPADRTAASARGGRRSSWPQRVREQWVSVVEKLSGRPDVSPRGARRSAVPSEEPTNVALGEVEDADRTQAPFSDYVLRVGRLGQAAPAAQALLPLHIGRNIIGRQPTAERGAHAVAIADDPTVSRNHLIIDLTTDGRLTVTDNRSRHGTSLNDARLTPGRAKPMRSGDRVRVGNTTLTVEQWQASATPPGRAPAPQNGILRIELAPEYRLRVTDGPDRGKQVAIGDRPLVIGRQPSCDWVLSGNQVSRRHAEVRQEGQVVRIRDLGSTHGLKVNDRPCQDCALDLGDRVAIGENALVFERL